MPFPTRIVANREDLDEVFTNKQNILQQTNVSNLMGLLDQLNKISLFANEIFTDILSTTKNTGNRIKIAKKRINNLETQLPKIENMLLQNAPSYFYDNPYSGKEYLRNDPLNGLLFTREDASNIINRRRDNGMTPTDLSKLDKISKKGPCIKQFTDSDFFINEWLANEKLKREEQREKRRQNKANRKKGKVKRKENKTIKKLQRKRYDDQGNVINATDEPTEIAVRQYQLTDDTNRNFDGLLKNNNKKSKKTKEAKKLKPKQPTKHEHAVSYGVPQNAINSAHVSVLSGNGNQPPPNPLKLAQSESNSDNDDGAQINNGGPSGAPPPNPLMLEMQQSNSQRTQNKLRGLSSNIPMNDISYEIPDNAPSPAQIYATNYQKRDLENEHIDLSAASNIIISSPKEVGPVAPKLGFLNDIAQFKEGKGVKLKRTEINVNRHRPKDKRTNLLDQLKNNKTKLSSVNLRKIAPKKEEKKNLIFEAMKDRRRHMEDSSDEEESDWGSDSE